MKSCGIFIMINGLAANKMHFKTNCFVYKQHKMGLFNYIVLLCIDFDDVNLTISPAELCSYRTEQHALSEV